jgi:sugar phosphate isomerase/epimerase
LNQIALSELVPSVSFHVHFHDVVDRENLTEPRAHEFFLWGVAL